MSMYPKCKHGFSDPLVDCSQCAQERLADELREQLQSATEKLENARAAFGEHPDSEIDLAARISQLRDSERDLFHRNTALGERLQAATREGDEARAAADDLAERALSVAMDKDELKEEAERYKLAYTEEAKKGDALRAENAQLRAQLSDPSLAIASLESARKELAKLKAHADAMAEESHEILRDRECWRIAKDTRDRLNEALTNYRKDNPK